MKNKKLSLFAIGSLLLTTSALAQTNNTSNTGNLAGTVSAAPVALDLGDGTGLLAVSTWLARRVHTLNVDGNIQDMIHNGLKTQKYVAGFSAEGALVYNFEIHQDGMEAWDETGRNAGLQVLPYTVQIMNDGTKRITTSGVAWRNMNALQNSKQAYHDGEAGGGSARADGFWKVVDRLDLVSFSWDKNLTFNNLQTMDIDIVNTGLKVALGSNDNGSYLALRGGGSLGMRFQNFTTPGSIPQSLTDDRALSQPGFLAQYYGGIEGNIQGKNGLKVNIQSNYTGGMSDVTFTDKNIVAQNAASDANYTNTMNQYNSALATWNQGLSQYEQAQGHVVSDADYAAASGNAQPVKPGKEGAAAGTDATMTRVFGYVKNSIDVSIPVNRKGRPMRIGVGAEYNIAITDRFQGYNGISFDMKGNYTQNLRGKLYLNF